MILLNKVHQSTDHECIFVFLVDSFGWWHLWMFSFVGDSSGCTHVGSTAVLTDKFVVGKLFSTNVQRAILDWKVMF